MVFETLHEVVDAVPHEAALNMAIDEVLGRAAEAPLLRIYQWAQPTLSIGYFEKIAAVAVPPPGWEIVRRWTGGGVVEHGRDLTYTLIVPASHPFARLRAAESYQRIHAGIAALLAGHGTAAKLASAATVKLSQACFENPTAADILADGRKIAGGAQRRTRWGLLHQGSVQGLAALPVLGGRLANALASDVVRRSLRAAEVDDARALAAVKYGTDAWLRRF